MTSLQFWILFSLLVGTSIITWLLFYNPFKNFKRVFKSKSLAEEKIAIIQNIINAIDNLKTLKKGALIILDDTDESNEFIADYQYLDAEISASLIINIFEGTNTPLHDGAIIINDGRIKSASAFISKLSKKRAPSNFGTRHRSALGLSEVTKAVIIVLSEETGNVHLFNRGRFEKILKTNFFEKIYEKWVRQEKEN